MLRTMRRRSRRFIFLVIFVLLFLFYKCLPLFGLLSEDGALDAISASELLNDSATYSNPELIPKIIHQTYKNDSIPLKWQLMQNMTLRYHSEYEYMFWTDDSALHFIAENYPSYLETYTSYRHPIQRADALRYFVLYHFGGIYFDLDITPRRKLDTLLTLPAFACLTTPTGISNDALGCTPGHPFFHYVIDSLKVYDKNWHSPYITVMSSTGPLFLSLVWKKWLDSGKNVGKGRLRVLMPEGRGYGFFVNTEGRSWQGADERFVAWLERHWLFDIVMGIVAVVWLVDRACRLFDWVWRRLRRRLQIAGVRGKWEVEWWNERGYEGKSFV